ncbi:MAG TPA: hypothetical protein PKK82_02465 [Anaerolineaceae bacterium]|nr:hypothetical protein [Chloroflexota bacterium]HNY83695.1 hypothetical protein [Anaerolineaceae bacterium]
MKTIKRPDEYEISIAIAAARASWIVGLLGLAAWVVYTYLTSSAWLWPAIIIISLMLLVFWSVELVGRLRVGKGDDD